MAGLPLFDFTIGAAGGAGATGGFTDGGGAGAFTGAGGGLGYGVLKEEEESLASLVTEEHAPPQEGHLVVVTLELSRSSSVDQTSYFSIIYLFKYINMQNHFVFY